MTQLDIDGLETAYVVRAAQDRGEPQLWVRALRIVRELGDPAGNAVREVRLRRGLNVVWAPPQAPYASALFDDGGMAGHTAGKTSFCRLVRYVLGEKHFGNEAVRRRVRAKLPSGWVLAEVVVGGKLWGVARPFAVGAHPFCVRGASLDEIASADHHVELRDYLDAIHVAVLSALPSTRFPDSDAAITWDHVLPWLTRDQECRFADFLTWRDPSSESEAPALSAAQRQFLARSVLGLITDAERAEQERNAELVRERQGLVERVPLLDHQRRIDASRMNRLLGNELPGAEGLLASASRDALARWRGELDARRERLAAEDHRAAASEATERAVEAATNALRDLEDVDARLDQERRTLAQLDTKASGSAVEALLESLPAGRRFCDVPMTEARAKGCPLATSRVVAVDELRAARQPAEERTEILLHVGALERRREEYARALTESNATRAAANSAYLRALTAYDEARDDIRREEDRLREAMRLFAHSDESLIEAERAETRVRHLTAEIDASYGRQEALREKQREAFGTLTVVFEHVARALLGPSVRASIDTSGRSLALHVERNGERESAALSTVKLLAFDLAALTASAEGVGAFPRFLLHDGPREADMARDIYDRLFLYARELERVFEGEPGFQYLLTTTTEPPAAFQDEPWMRLLLSGAESEARLYRMDF